jgi:hypothetical protein
MRAKISKRKKLHKNSHFFVTRYNFTHSVNFCGYFTCSFQFCTFNFQGQDSVLNESFRTSQAWFDIISFLIFFFSCFG